jgi:YD repeat-containing protein
MLVDSTSVTVTPDVQSTTMEPVVEQTVDRWGNVLSISDPRNQAWLTEYQYDDQSRLLRETKPQVDVQHENSTVEQLRPVSRNFYDRLGRVIGIQDANGSMNTVRYNAAGQIIREVHADGGTVDRSYDGLGRQVGEWDERDKFTARTYDLNDRLTRVTRPDGTYEEYQYDELGNRISERNGAGLVTTYRYDPHGRVIRASKPGGATTLTYYDQAGNKSREVNANGDDQLWEYDAFGRKTSYSDLGDAATTYTYNLLGGVSSEASSRAQTTYSYGANGALVRVDNSALSAVDSSWWTESTEYAYDAAGNRIRETYIKNGETHLDAVATFDALNRVLTVNDARYNLTYTYDANGNRRHTLSSFYSNVGTLTSKEYWYKYDSMNRIVLSQGVWSGSAITLGNQGTAISYDAAGNRVSASGASTSNVNETYQYDDNGRLERVYRDGTIASRRYYDGANNVVRADKHDGNGAQISYQINNYDANGIVTSQETYKHLSYTSEYGTHYDTGLSSKVTYTSRDALGQVLSYKVDVYDPEITEAGQDESGNLTHVLDPGYVYTNTYAYTRVRYGDSYKESVVSGTSTYYQPGSTTTRYDGNGSIYSVTDQFNGSNDRTFVTDQSGRIVRKTQNSGQHEYYFYANGKPLGATGAGGAADFDFNYTPISEDYPAQTPSTYVVNSGDTLRAIAQAVYGDGALWYLIADANGISSDAQLKVGTTLTIPNKITNLHNTFETFKPYNPSEIIGDTTPTLPDPPPSSDGGCGGFGMILVIAVTMVVAAYFPPAVGLTSTSFAGMVAGAMAGNFAGQFVGVVLGVRDSIDMEEVVGSGLTAGISYGVSAATSSIATNLGVTGNGVVDTAVRHVIREGLTQGANILLGRQDKFDWLAIATAGIAAPVAGAVIDRIDGSGFAADFSRQLAGNIANSAVGAIVGRKKFDMSGAVKDAFQNTVANAFLADSNGATSRAEQQAKLEQAYGETWDGDDAELGAAMRQSAAEADLAETWEGDDAELGAAMRQAAFERQIADNWERDDADLGAAMRSANAREPDRAVHVRAGDSLSRIAGTNDPRVLERIAQYNGLTSAHAIREGATLRIPPREVVDSMDLEAGRLDTYSQQAAQFEARMRAKAQELDAAYSTIESQRHQQAMSRYAAASDSGEAGFVSNPGGAATGRVYSVPPRGSLDSPGPDSTRRCWHGCTGPA